MGIPGQSNNFTAKIPVTKSYENHIVKKSTSHVYPLHVLRPDLDSPQDSKRFSQGILKKPKN
jgi:hypothetical protein